MSQSIRLRASTAGLVEHNLRIELHHLGSTTTNFQVLSSASRSQLDINLLPLAAEEVIVKGNDKVRPRDNLEKCARPVA